MKSNPTNLGAKTPSGNQSTSKVNPAPQTSVPQVFVVKPTAPTASKIIPAPAGLQTTSASNTTKPATELPKKPADSTSVKPTTQVAQPQNPTVQFHSASIDPAAKKADYFAEQNQKAAAEKTKHKKITKKVLLISSIVAVLLIAMVILLIFLFKKPAENTPAEENTATAQGVYDEAMAKINSIYNGNSTSSTTPSAADIGAANEIFESAIVDAGNANNTGEADALRVAQMLFYVNISTDYSEMIRIGEEVKNIDALELQQQLQYYNIMASAYAMQNNPEKANEYYNKAAEISDRINGYTSGEGDKGE